MTNVINVTINPDIVLDEKSTKGMPEYIKDNVLITMTLSCQKYGCHWTDLTWRVRYDTGGNPYITVKKK
ncbi:hypothetical protein LCGC14_0756720 [marine sediment metagenome]|uniref:Uncharacterized protein n=1 Tax=marine sediment metagenome TaxID=412755 RepID=A0A0F9SMJ8_9ZZZZ|nr:hypothetical protein [Pricia sp.]